ncbi:hypothetical protein B296_00044222, partial [Ensete ventricosum]
GHHQLNANREAEQTWVELGEVSKPHEGSRRRRWKHETEAWSFPWTEVKDMNSCRGKSGIMSFHGFFILMERTHFAWCQRRREFRGTYTYLRKAFDRWTKVIQLAEAKLESEGLSTRQEDTEAGTLEEYVLVLLFELS